MKIGVTRLAGAAATALFASYVTIASSFTGCKSSTGGTTPTDGGGSPPGDGGTTPTEDSAPAADGAAGTSCADYSATYCNFLGLCEPGTMATTYGTAATCVATVEATCTRSLAATGSAWTPGFTTACGASYASKAGACADGGPQPLPIPAQGDPCQLVGAEDAGAPCSVNSQCGTDECLRPGSLCGTCSSPGQMGEGCGFATGVTCARGLTCSTANSTCVPTVGLDSPCTLGVADECVGGANCVVSDAGASSGTCLASGVAAGTPCSPKSVGRASCWAAAGFYCNETTDTCAPIAYGAPGALCGAASEDAGARDCTYGDCVSASCVGLIAAGQPCSIAEGAACVGGAVCVVSGSGVAGTCTAVTGAACATATAGSEFTFQPSNVTLATIEAALPNAADEIVAANCTVQTDPTSPISSCFTSSIVAAKQSDGSTVNVAVLRSLVVQTGATVTVSGSVPLVIVSLSDVLWSGALAANAAGETPGPGGAITQTSNAAGAGTGGGLAGSGTVAIGGGGGSFCGQGGPGGGADAGAPAAYGAQDCDPLLAGSSGGAGAEDPGAGGGAVQIVAAGALVVKAGAVLNVGGGGGTFGGAIAGGTVENAAGGGTGGSLLLEGTTVTINGTLAANGGGGGGASAAGTDGSGDATPAPGGTGATVGGVGGAGATPNGAVGQVSAGNVASGGGGGAGRIRINSSDGTVAGKATYSPSVASTCTTIASVRALGSGY